MRADDLTGERIGWKGKGGDGKVGVFQRGSLEGSGGINDNRFIDN